MCPDFLKNRALTSIGPAVQRKKGCFSMFGGLDTTLIRNICFYAFESVGERTELSFCVYQLLISETVRLAPCQEPAHLKSSGYRYKVYKWPGKKANHYVSLSFVPSRVNNLERDLFGLSFLNCTFYRCLSYGCLVPALVHHMQVYYARRARSRPLVFLSPMVVPLQSVCRIEICQFRVK